MGGRFPWMGAFDGSGKAIVTTAALNYNIASGEYMTIDGVFFSSARHQGLKIVAREDHQTRFEPTCFSRFGVIPDSDSATLPYAIPAELIVGFHRKAPWYYSKFTVWEPLPYANCELVPNPGICVWMAGASRPDFDPLQTIKIPDIPKIAAFFSAGVPGSLSASDIEVVTAFEYGQSLPKKRSEGQHTNITIKGNGDFGYAYIDEQSAAPLCNSGSSYGPSYLSSKEDLYCDMRTKTLYKNCKVDNSGPCFETVNNKLKLHQRKSSLSARSLSHEVDLVPLKKRSVAVPLKKRSLARRALHKRDDKAPSCTESSRPLYALASDSVTTLDSNQYLQSNSLAYRVAVTRLGMILLFKRDSADKKPSIFDRTVWTSKKTSIDDQYYLTLKTNGQMCVRDSAQVLFLCVNSAGNTADGPFKLTVSDAGTMDITKKNGQLLWSSGGNVIGDFPSNVDGQAVTDANALFSRKPKFGAFSLWSVDKSTELRYDGSNTLCTYNKNKFQTSCFSGKSGLKNYRVQTSDDGRLCIAGEEKSGVLSSQCLGGTKSTGDYVAVVHNDGFIHMYDSDSKQYWIRGGGHYFDAKNTLRADKSKGQDQEVASRDGKYSMYSHSCGGLAIRDNKDSKKRLVWAYSGGRACGPGLYGMYLGLDGSLCITNQKTGAKLECMGAKGDNAYDFLLYMETDGRSYIYGNDGKSKWNSGAPKYQ